MNPTQSIMKLAIIVGTRPELIRLTMTIMEARKHFDVKLLHTGQNYDPNLKDVFLNEFGITDCESVNWVGSNSCDTVGKVISRGYEWLNHHKPDALLILGDTNSCMVAYAAKRLKIPIFHMEAGNRCFDQNLPEEVNRKMIDHISDVNICYTEHARRNLLAEGLPAKYTFVVGSPMAEVIRHMSSQIDCSNILEQLGISKNKYILVSFHREENVDNPTKLAQLLGSLNCMAAEYDVPIIMSTHPRTRNKITIQLDSRIRLCQPFKYSDYCYLQVNALFVASDSGTLAEEASILGFRAVSLRDSTEHPEAIDAGTMVLGTTKWSDLSISINLSRQPEDVYGYSPVAQTVCSIISGYTPIINKYVWFK